MKYIPVVKSMGSQPDHVGPAFPTMQDANDYILALQERDRKANNTAQWYGVTMLLMQYSNTDELAWMTENSAKVLAVLRRRKS